MATDTEPTGDEHVQNILLTQGEATENPTPVPGHSEREFSPSQALSNIDRVDNVLEKKLNEFLRVDDSGEPGYVPPMEDPYDRAVKYLERYNVMHIFQQLTASLVFHRPEDPLQFMLDEITKIQNGTGEEQSVEL